MPLGYEVFAWNRQDSTTLEENVETMERRYGRFNRIWVMDRGMASEEHQASCCNDWDFNCLNGSKYIKCSEDF